MNCITYARVSTEKQAEKELSIPAQLSAMREYAQRQDWAVLEEFIEPGASARSAERPVLKQMLARCKSEPKVDVVLVHKIDRLARNVYDHATIKALLKQRSIRLASVVENMDDSIAGQLVENIMASIADFYSANLGEEVKKGMGAKIARGEWPHKPPLGYRSVKGADGRSKVEPDPATAPVMQEAFSLYSSGFYSVRQVAVELAPKGLMTRLGGPLPQSHLHVLLRNPFYVGRLEWKGKIYPGVHNAVVTPETFARVQQLLSVRYRRGPTRYGSLEFWLKDVAHCGACGARMTAERHKSHTYYRCLANARGRSQCSAPFCNADRVHERLMAVYRTLRLSDVGRRQLLAAAEARVATAKAGGEFRNRPSLVLSRTRLLERQLKAAESYSAGDTPKEVYVAFMERSGRELAALDERLRAANVNPSSEMTAIRERIKTAASLWDFHQDLPAGDRGRLAHAVFAHLGLLEGSVVGISLRPECIALLDQSLRAKSEALPDAGGLGSLLDAIARTNG